MAQRARSAERKLEKREELLAAALRLFRGRGWAGTTIEMITAEAGLSPGAFYRYFSGKLEIYRSLTAEGSAILAAAMGRAAEGAGSDPGERLRALASAYLAFYTENRDYYDIVAILHLGQGDFFADLRGVGELEERAKAMVGLVEAAIKAGVEAGSFRPVEPWRTAVAFWGMLDGILILDVKQGTGYLGEKLGDLFEAAVELALGGLRP